MNSPASFTNSETVPSRAEFSVDKALAVLNAPYGLSPRNDLNLLREQLPVLADSSVEGGQYYRLLELFFFRALKLSAALKPELRDASLPLSHDARNIGRYLSGTFKSLSSAYRWALANNSRQKQEESVSDYLSLTGQAMKCLYERLVIAALTAAPQPGGVWHAAYQLYLEVRSSRTGRNSRSSYATTDPEYIFCEMVALAGASPESLSAREIFLVAEYVALFADAVTIQEQVPESAQKDAALFWIDTHNDQAPYAMVRRVPTLGMDQTLYFSCRPLAERVEGHIRSLENGFKPEDVHLPDSANEPDYVMHLRLLQRRWRAPLKRQYPRRRNNYQIQLCPGFDTLWQLLQHRDQEMAIQAKTGGLDGVSNWMVVNGGPAGYALMHTSGVVDKLENGSVVAIRAKSDQPWEVCVVRWISSDNPEHIELGVQVVAHSASPVQVGFHTAKNPSLELGLLLEPVPSLRQKPAVLVKAGTCRGRRFSLVSSGNRIYVAQGNVASLELQTASVELFQFEIDQKPL